MVVIEGDYTVRDSKGVHFSRCAAKCDGCGVVGPWRYDSTDWDVAIAIEEAKSAGWKQFLDGQMLKMHCPECKLVG